MGVLGMGYKSNKLDIEKLKEKKDVKGLIKALKYEDKSYSNDCCNYFRGNR